MTHQELVSAISYDPETGEVLWRVSRGKAAKGKKAGWVSRYGYRQLCLFGKIHFVSRLVWFYHYKRWPQQRIDHINGNRLDNRIANLRDVSYYENNINTEKHRSGHLVGTTKRKEGWIAQFRTPQGRKRAGPFQTALEAHKAYKKLHFPETSIL